MPVSLALALVELLPGLIKAGVDAFKMADGTEIDLKGLKVQTTTEKLKALGVSEADIKRAMERP